MFVFWISFFLFFVFNTGGRRNERASRFSSRFPDFVFRLISLIDFNSETRVEALQNSLFIFCSRSMGSRLAFVLHCLFFHERLIFFATCDLLFAASRYFSGSQPHKSDTIAFFLGAKSSCPPALFTWEMPDTMNSGVLLQKHNQEKKAFLSLRRTVVDHFHFFPLIHENLRTTH